MQEFVDAFNETIARINEYDSYNQETEVRGPLLGDPTVAQVRNSLYSTLSVQRRTSTVPISSSARSASPSVPAVPSSSMPTASSRHGRPTQGVENLFVSFDSETSSTEQVSEGSPSNVTTIYASLGFGDLFDQMLEGLTASTGA